MMWVLRLHRYMAVDEAEELSDIKPYLESIGLKPRIIMPSVQGMEVSVPLGWKIHKEMKPEGMTYRLANRSGTDMFTFRHEGRAFFIHYRPGQDQK